MKQNHYEIILKLESKNPDKYFYYLNIGRIFFRTTNSDNVARETVDENAYEVVMPLSDGLLQTCETSKC